MEILVIEDNQAEIDLIQSCLNEIKKEDYIHFIKNGEEAIEYAITHPNRIKIILLDLNLPKMKGDEVLSRLKKSKKTKNIPVVIFSTSSDPDEIKKTYLLGSNSFVTKPMGIKKFKKAISSIYDFWIEHNQISNN